MAFNVEESQRQWRETWKRDAPTGDPGNHILWENATVRVWQLELAPGESSALHTHMNPYLFVVIESAKVRTMFPDGSISDDTDATGAVVWAGLDDARRTHTLTNIDDRRYLNRVIEVLT
jgi:hypothetical protein